MPVAEKGTSNGQTAALTPNRDVGAGGKSDRLNPDDSRYELFADELSAVIGS